jgi:hypothetical protein
VAFEHAERDAEEDVESVKEQDIPYAEKRLNRKSNKNPIVFHIIYFTKRSTGHSDDERERRGTLPRRADSR